MTKEIKEELKKNGGMYDEVCVCVLSPLFLLSLLSLFLRHAGLCFFFTLNILLNTLNLFFLGFNAKERQLQI